MLKKTIKILDIGLILIFILNFNALAEIYYLDLERAQELARTCNPDLLRVKMDLNSAEAAFAITKSDFFPELKLDLIAPNYNERMSEQYVYQPSDSSYAWQWINTGDYRYQGSLNLEQKLPTGGTFNISTLLYKRDYFTGSASDSMLTEYSSVTRFSIQQPLLQSNSLRNNYMRGRNNLQKAFLEGQIRHRDLDYVIALAYYSLVRAERRLKLEEEDFQRWQTTVKTAEDKFKAGLIPEVEVLKLKVELARREGALAASRGTYFDTADDLKQTLGLDLADSLVLATEVEKLSLPEGEIKSAIANRFELKKSELDLKNAEISYRQSKSNANINANFMVYYDFDAKQPYMENLIDNYETDRGLSLTLSFPFLDWGAAHNNVEINRINLNRTQFDLDQQKKDFTAELASTQRSLDAARSRLECAQLAEQLASKSYDMTLTRFGSGSVTAEILIDAQISLNQARHELLDSTIDYNIKAVKYKTMYFPPPLER